MQIGRKMTELEAAFEVLFVILEHPVLKLF